MAWASTKRQPEVVVSGICVNRRTVAGPLVDSGDHCPSGQRRPFGRNAVQADYRLDGIEDATNLRIAFCCTGGKVVVVVCVHLEAVEGGDTVDSVGGSEAGVGDDNRSAGWVARAALDGEVCRHAGLDDFLAGCGVVELERNWETR